MTPRILLVLLFVVIGSSASYDENVSKIMAGFSAISHCTDKGVVDWTCAECKKVPKLTDVVVVNNKETDIHGFMGYYKDMNRIVVAWRGTIDAKNWIEDFGYKKIPYSRCKGCEVHAGFFAAYASVEKSVDENIVKLMNKYPNASIAVTGQSLGGALSTFCAIELQLKTNKVAELYNFGCPRVGNDATATFIDSKLQTRFRVVHNRDIVPHVPFEEMGFRHIAFEVFYDEAMKTYKVCSSSGEDNTCSNKFDPFYDTSDHDVYWVRMDDSIC